MLDGNNVPSVADDERLARYILYSNHVRADRTLKADAFVPHPHEELSVTRHQQASEGELWSIGEEIARLRDKLLHGRGDAIVGTFLSVGLDVRADPVPSNPNHALVTNWPNDKPAQKMKALEVARTA